MPETKGLAAVKLRHRQLQSAPLARPLAGRVSC